MDNKDVLLLRTNNLYLSKQPLSNNYHQYYNKNLTLKVNVFQQEIIIDFYHLLFIKYFQKIFRYQNQKKKEINLDNLYAQKISIHCL